MEIARITANGRITIPASIRKALNVKDGDKVLCVQDGDKVVMMNASIAGLVEAQQEFQGVAESLGLRDEQDVVELVRQIRST